MPDERSAEGEDWPEEGWTDDPSDPDDGFDDRFDEFFGDRDRDRDGDDAFEDGAGSGRGGKGRIAVGVALLVLGAIVAIVAITQIGGDDDSDASKTEVKAVTTTSADDETTTTATPTIVPTTLAGGALPTGCGNWDPAFSFDPDPIEGVVIYSDFEGWHVVLGPEGPPVVTGTVVGQTTPVVSTEPPGPGVQLIADPATSTVTFRLTAGDEPVGFDFAADCTQKQLTFDLKDADGAPIDAADVHLGRTGGVTALPVVAQRQQPPPG
ncbi:MAG TPA: hypothetical protein VNS19_20530 [Acidimicrobiales bacterium]|nr:hypothetical protein [Acidimicrobiales bacterium]